MGSLLSNTYHWACLLFKSCCRILVLQSNRYLLRANLSKASFVWSDIWCTDSLNWFSREDLSWFSVNNMDHSFPSLRSSSWSRSVSFIALSIKSHGRWNDAAFLFEDFLLIPYLKYQARGHLKNRLLRVRLHSIFDSMRWTFCSTLVKDSVVKWRRYSSLK